MEDFTDWLINRETSIKTDEKTADYIEKSKIKEHIKNRKKSIDDIWSRNKIELDYETIIKIKRLEIEIDVLETLMEEELNGKKDIIP